MALVALAATHRTVDLEMVARLHAGLPRISSEVLADNPVLAGAITLPTCNRLEIYCETRSDDDVEAALAAVLDTISRCSGLSWSVVSSSFTTFTGSSVAEHLFSVGAGLDSAVVGEQEIGGQVRRALAAAQSAGTAGSALTRLFQAACRSTKEVGARTELGGTGRSIVALALDLAARPSRQADLSGSSAVVIGTGAYAGSTVAALAARKCSRISVFSWSGRAEAFAAARGAIALTATELPLAVQQADVIVGCSGSGRIIGEAELRSFRGALSRPLAVVDLALGRDFASDVADLPDVELITLETVRMAATQEQSDTLRRARDLVRQAVRRFADQEESRAGDPAIVALRGYAQQVLNSEMERVRIRHGCKATAEDVEFALRRMLRQLLHVPTIRARELAEAGRQDDYAAALEVLFGPSLQLSERQGSEVAR